VNPLEYCRSSVGDVSLLGRVTNVVHSRCRELGTITGATHRRVRYSTLEPPRPLPRTQRAHHLARAPQRNILSRSTYSVDLVEDVCFGTSGTSPHSLFPLSVPIVFTLFFVYLYITYESTPVFSHPLPCIPKPLELPLTDESSQSDHCSFYSTPRIGAILIERCIVADYSRSGLAPTCSNLAQPFVRCSLA
jgi:hypothetical protein